MHDEKPMMIPRNPSQIPPSQFRISRNLKVRGDAIYILFGGIIAAVCLFVALMDTSAILALAVSWMPLALSTWFYFRFVREKPPYYFEYWLNGLFGTALRIHPKQVVRFK